MMISLRDKETGAEVGTISEQELQFLVDQLEEEFDEDRDYYLNQTTLDVMEQNRADPDLVALLRRAIGDREGIEIEWSRTE
jgi:hypothetical protein